MKQLLIGLGMCAATALIVLAGSAKAETSKGTGLVCKSQAGVEAIFDYGVKNPTASIGDAIAAGVKDECDVKSIMYEKGEAVLTLAHGTNKYDVTKITVLAVCEQGVCIFGKEEAFTIFQHVEKTSSLTHWMGLYEDEDLAASGYVRYNAVDGENRRIIRQVISRNGW